MKSPLVFFLAIMASCGVVLAQEQEGDDKYARETLKGIRAIMVLVETLDPNIESDGLTTDQLKTDVELRLRKAVLPQSSVVTLP